MQTAENKIHSPFSLTRLFVPRASARPRIYRVRLSLVMEDETREPTPERLAVSEKRKERREQKKLKQQAKVKSQPAPEQQQGNSAFLVRPWISLPQVDGAQVKGSVRVMTWNVCPICPDVLGRNSTRNPAASAISRPCVDQHSMHR